MRTFNGKRICGFVRITTLIHLHVWTSHHYNRSFDLVLIHISIPLSVFHSFYLRYLSPTRKSGEDITPKSLSPLARKHP